MPNPGLYAIDVLERFFAVASPPLPTDLEVNVGQPTWDPIEFDAASGSGGQIESANSADVELTPFDVGGTVTEGAIRADIGGSPVGIASFGILGLSFLAGDVLTILAGKVRYLAGYSYGTRATALAFLDHMLGVSALSPPANLWAGVLVDSSSFNPEDGSYTEVSTSGYARTSVDGLWGAASVAGDRTTIQNDADVSFAPILGGWDTSQKTIAIFDAASGGNLWGICKFASTTGLSLSAGNLVVAAGGLQVDITNDSGPAPNDWLNIFINPLAGSGVDYTLVSGVTEGLDHARGPDTRLLVAMVLAGALTVRRYDDALPEALAATTSIEGSGVTACSLGCRRSGVVDLLYSHSGAVKHRTSRDQGATFSVPITIATGYDVVTHDHDEADGMLAAMVWKSNSWYVTVGELDEAGSAWSFSTPALVVAGKRAGASLKRVAGRWEFAYISSGGAASLLHCKALAKTGAGAWA